MCQESTRRADGVLWFSGAVWKIGCGYDLKREEFRPFSVAGRLVEVVIVRVRRHDLSS
jgi:hypothetical protein